MKRTEHVDMDEAVRYMGIEDDTFDERSYSSEELSRTELAELIQHLKDNYRIALTLRYIEGFDNEEIAQIMGISHENTRTLISRAKQKLKGLLSEQKLDRLKR